MEPIFLVPGRDSGFYLYITIEGFPISKSRKPKSPEFNEFILKMSYPLPGIRGKKEMDI